MYYKAILQKLHRQKFYMHRWILSKHQREFLNVSNDVLNWFSEGWNYKNRKGIVIHRLWVFEFRNPVLYFRDVSELRIPPNLRFDLYSACWFKPFPISHHSFQGGAYHYPRAQVYTCRCHSDVCMYIMRMAAIVRIPRNSVLWEKVKKVNCLRGNCTPNQELASFVPYLKIINTFLKNDTCILKQIVQGTQNVIGILVCQAVFKLWIKTVKMLFGSVTQELLGLSKF